MTGAGAITSRPPSVDPTPQARRRSGRLRLAVHQVGYEHRSFWRNRSRAFFSFVMPVMLLVVFGSLIGHQRIAERADISFATFFVPGILASITDAIGAIVVMILVIIWSVFMLIGAVISVVKAIL